MGIIDHLPGGGDKFRALAGVGSFKNKLKVAVKSSSLMQPLSDNQEAIVKAVRKYQLLIRKGKFGYTQRNAALSQIQHASPLQGRNKLMVRKILKHLSEDNSDSQPKIKHPEEEAPVVPRFSRDLATADDHIPGRRSPSISHLNSAPTVSAAQAQREHIGTGMAGNYGPPNQPPKTINHERPPMIPLAR
jgi:hypothetical protein